MKLSELIGAKVKIGSLSGRNIFSRYDAEVTHIITDINVRVTSDGKIYPTAILKDYPKKVFLFKDLFLVEFNTETEVSEDNSIHKESSVIGQKYPDWPEISNNDTTTTTPGKYPDWSQAAPGYREDGQYDSWETSRPVGGRQDYPDWPEIIERPIGGPENYPDWPDIESPEPPEEKPSEEYPDWDEIGTEKPSEDYPDWSDINRK